MLKEGKVCEEGQFWKVVKCEEGSLFLEEWALDVGGRNNSVKEERMCELGMGCLRK